MIGLDASGRTTYLYRLKLGEVVTTIPTIGFNVETVTSHGVTLTMWDVGGCDKIRPLWRHYFQNTQVVFLFIDSNDRDRLSEAAEEFDKMTRDSIFCANKQDIPTAMPVKEIVEKAGFNEMFKGRIWNIFPVTSIGTDDLIYQPIAWVGEKMRERNSRPPSFFYQRSRKQTRETS